MLHRASRIAQVLTQELARHDRALEIDEGLTKIELTVFISRRTGGPSRVLYVRHSESDLTENGKPK